MSTNFTRWSGIAALSAGLIIIAGAFLAEPCTGQYLLSGLLAILGLIGLLLALRREGAGRRGLLGILTTLATIVLGVAFIGTGYGLWTAPVPPASPASTPN